MKHKDVKIEIKSVDDAGSFTGYAAVFGNVDLGGDVIAPGAFTKTISEKTNHPVLWSHRMGEPIGVNRSYKEDDHGLLVEGQLVLDVQRAREVHALMKAGAVTGMSIGYDTVTDEYNRDTKIRTLKELKLWEYSFTPFPMNPEAQVVGVKSVDDMLTQLEGIVSFISDQKSPESRALIAQMIKALQAAQAPEAAISARRAAQAPAAATHDNVAPEIFHAGLDSIETLIRRGI